MSLWSQMRAVDARVAERWRSQPSWIAPAYAVLAVTAFASVTFVRPIALPLTFGSVWLVLSTVSYTVRRRSDPSRR